MQGAKFDAQGHYIRRWVPELGRLPNEYLFAPWEAPAEVLTRAGVELGKNYPQPLVNHGDARESALAALQSMRSRAMKNS